MQTLPKRDRPAPMLYIVLVTSRPDGLSLVNIIRTPDNAAALFETSVPGNAITAVRLMADGHGDYTYSFDHIGYRDYTRKHEDWSSELIGSLPCEIKRIIYAIQEALDASV